MSEIANPHDSFFKDLLARPEMATDFLVNYLPPEVAAELDLTAPELVKDSFIDAELQPHFSDLLYRVRLKRGGEAYVYILFEHKSAPDVWVGFQLFRYKARIWEPLVRQKVKKLPPIFPLVLYHGRARWRAARNFGALIEWQGARALRQYVPEFEYYLIDLSAFGDAEIKGAVFLRVGLLLLKHIFSRRLWSQLPLILGLLPVPAESALEYIQTVMTYVAAVTGRVTESKYKEILVQAFPAMKETVMQTFNERWITQGIQQGIQQGRQEGSLAITLRQLQRRLSALEAETEKRIRALSFEQLEQLGEALLDFNSPDDLAAWLREHAVNGSPATTQG